MQGPYIELWFSSVLAFPLWMLGGIMLLLSFWNFLFKGRALSTTIRNGHGDN